MLREIPSYAVGLAREGIINARAQGQADSVERLIRSARSRAAAEVQAAKEQAQQLRSDAWQSGYCEGFGAVLDALVPALCAQMLAEQQVLGRVLDAVRSEVSGLLKDGRVYTELAGQTVDQSRDGDDSWTVYLPKDQQHLAAQLQARVTIPLQVKQGEATYPVIACGDRVVELDPSAGLIAQAQTQAGQWLTPQLLQGWVDDFSVRLRQQLARKGGIHILNQQE